MLTSGDKKMSQHISFFVLQPDSIKTKPQRLSLSPHHERQDEVMDSAQGVSAGRTGCPGLWVLSWGRLFTPYLHSNMAEGSEEAKEGDQVVAGVQDKLFSF